MNLQREVFDGFNGMNLVADVTGDPAHPVVIMMHGGGQTRGSWSGTVSLLTDLDCRVISLDLRGHGESDWAKDGDYAPEAFAADLAAVVATLPLPPILMGASLGGMTAMIAVGELKVKARALILVDIVPNMKPEGVDRIEGFMNGNPNGFASFEEAVKVVSEYLSHRPVPPSVEGLRRNLRLDPDGRYRWHWDPEFQHWNNRNSTRDKIGLRMSAAASNCHIPTLVIRGGSSELVDEEGVEHLLSLLPRGEAYLVEKAGHMVAGDRNDIFNAGIAPFVRRVLSARFD